MNNLIADTSNNLMLVFAVLFVITLFLGDRTKPRPVIARVNAGCFFAALAFSAVSLVAWLWA